MKQNLKLGKTSVQTVACPKDVKAWVNRPDDYFTLMAELSYQRFMLKDWSYLYIMLNNGQYMNTGNCNSLSLNLTLSRNSTDNPIFPRYGSEFSASLQITPPYSLFSKKDYSTYGKNKL